jgi:hypothetical protein
MVWLIVATLWVISAATLGALVARAMGLDPVVGLALSVVLGPLGWLGLPILQRQSRRGASAVTADSHLTAQPALRPVEPVHASGRKL